MSKDEKLLQDMSELWKEIFHDSDSYVSLIINEKLDLSLCEWCYNDAGEMTSMIIGIPYTFMGHSLRFRGLYLCGVCTREEYRGRGEIQQLMHSVEAKATDAKFDFTFLIPANEQLRQFYTKSGYKNMSNIYHNCCINCDIKVSKILEKSDEIPDSNFLAKLYNFDNICIDKITEIFIHSEQIFNDDVLKILKEIERGSGRYFLCHTKDQWYNVYKDWLESGNEIYYVYSFCSETNPRNVCYDNMKLYDIVFLNKNLINHRLREELSRSPFIGDVVCTSYGMMKDLNGSVPDSCEFGLSFMMD